jgi:alpha-beta hydrolase superfamily lysophospholipase
LSFRKRFIDYRAIKFPEFNPVEVIVQQNGQDIMLASFRFPAQTKLRKGIVFYLNGYADYAERYGYFAQYFANAGYDFVTVDPRGFGRSEGRRAFIENDEIFAEDYIKFH